MPNDAPHLCAKPGEVWRLKRASGGSIKLLYVQQAHGREWVNPDGSAYTGKLDTVGLIERIS